MKADSNKYRSFKQIVNLFYNEAFEKTDETKEHNKENNRQIKIEPKFFYDDIEKHIKVEIFIGINKMYKIEKLSKFYDRMTEEKKYKYGDKLEFIHNREAFEKDDLPMLDFVMKYAEIIKYGNSNSNANYRFGTTALSESKIVLNDKEIDKVFDMLINKTINIQKDAEEFKIKLINQNPDIKFVLKKTTENEYNFFPNINLYKTAFINGKRYKYLLVNNVLYRCDDDFNNSTMKLLDAFKKNYLSNVKLSKEQLPQLFSIIIPKIQNKLELDEANREELEIYLPKKVTSRLYLDFESNNLIAKLRFVYDETEYNPLEEDIKKQKSRNIIEETKALNILRKTQFMLDRKKLRFILTDEDRIYKFITEDIEEYMKNFEILATDNFNSKQIKQPKISSIGVKIENNLLELDLEKLNIDTKELMSIMEKYSLKKKYHRLKDGTFLKLEDNEDIEFLNKLITGADVDYKELTTGIIRLPMHRTLYLNQLLDGLKNTTIDENQKYKEVVDNLSKENVHYNIEIPYMLNNILRFYQKVGFKWLKTLDNYRFGGILADDMGLGKTIQVLSIIMSYVDEKSDENKKASLVVSPSSLALNWENEANKFTAGLNTMVISGTAYERKKKIESIDNYDLVITSYDSLKRDIEYYNEKNYKFKYIIADEAQYLKNSSTQNAIAIKNLQSETRYALTGTPMENSLSELWSIFDFIMPGYLFSYRKFKNLYETPIVKEKDETSMKKLKMLIEPFVLRRTKAQVLTELPEKTITVLTSDMEEEQRNIYLSYLTQAKAEVKESIDLNGLERSHMRILAVLTRLRQICCHPSVFIENYVGGSSKLDQCMELVKNGIESGHRILLFSGYTSMFPIIEEELRKAGLKYFKLTGATKVNDRIGLVEEFNSNDDIKVFLISLKAGGTGLNLTGADMVIHYDPWWNASAENQATDRAHRIGQKNNVQVYKLITKDSIEEKIYELQKNKSALIDNMLDINTSFVNKLSREEIMELFE